MITSKIIPEKGLGYAMLRKAWSYKSGKTARTSGHGTDSVCSDESLPVVIHKDLVLRPPRFPFQVSYAEENVFCTANLKIRSTNHVLEFLYACIHIFNPIGSFTSIKSHQYSQKFGEKGFTARQRNDEPRRHD